jgi:hypothetical protein
MQLIAQTGIGTPTPDASAKLDVFFTTKVFLPPRVALSGTNDVSTIASPPTGLFIILQLLEQLQIMLSL